MAKKTPTDDKSRPAATAKRPAPTPVAARLTAADVASIDALDQATGDSPPTRLDLADLLTHPSTSAALAHYQTFFDAGDVPVAGALAALPAAIDLAELERRLDVARAKVRRNRLQQAEPIAAIVFGVHRLVAATPKGSKMREAFDAFLKAWGETYTGGSPDEPPPPAAPTK